MSEAKPIDILLFCPNCGGQHVDEARPGICETCGKGESKCDCLTFTAWLNPPHKSHRCNFCNHVWRPADIPTNGVAAINTKGERDGDPKPTYHASNAIRFEREACAKIADELRDILAAEAGQKTKEGITSAAVEQYTAACGSAELIGRQIRARS